MPSLAWDLSLGSYRLGSFAWDSSLGNFRLEMFPWDVSFGERALEAEESQKGPWGCPLTVVFDTLRSTASTPSYEMTLASDPKQGVLR